MKYLIFELEEERYAISLSSVKEVIGITPITPVPHVPHHFKGIINLRGKIISVIDLRAKLGFKEKEYTQQKTCIVITDVNETTIGAIVDDVIEVVNFTTEQIESNIDIQSKVSAEFIVGVAKRANNLNLIIDIAKTLNFEDFKNIRQDV